jgi:cell division protein FtsB
MNKNRRRTTNSLEVNVVARVIIGAFLVGMAALFFVYLKNQQHAVGNQARVTEAALREAQAKNEGLKARITAMTSRGALQRRLDEGYIKLDAIRDTAIARITPAVTAEEDGVLRTASRDPASRFGPGAPQRTINR